MPLSSSPQRTINPDEWHLNYSTRVTQGGHEDPHSSRCILPAVSRRHLHSLSVPKRLGIPLQINGKKRLEERSGGAGGTRGEEEKMKEKWDRSTAQIRKKIQEKQKRLLQVSCAASPTGRNLCCLLPEDFFFVSLF